MGFPDAKWAVDQVVSKIGVQPNNMRKFVATPLSETSIGLQFLEPADSYYSEGGALAAVTKGVMIRMSTEGYPQRLNDGELVVDNTNLGMYENTNFVVNGLTEGVTYYFTAFPYSNIGVYNESLNAANKVTGVPAAAEIVTVNIAITDESKFNSAVVTLRNITDGTAENKTVYEAGSVVFDAKDGKTFRVEVTSVDGYMLDKTQTENFVAAAGSTRTFTFTYTLGFIYTITFDNGGDGIPASFEYSDDCAGFTPMNSSNYNGWAGSKLLDHFRPCVIKPGAANPEYYLQKNDYTKKEDGTASVLTGADGDVMVEVTQLYYKVTKLADTNEIKLSISDIKVDSTYKAFLRDSSGEFEKAYRGVYEAYSQSNQMRSISGVAPTVNITRAAFRTLANARGNEYAQNDYYLLFMWQCMYIMLYGSRDSQTALGKGRTLSSNTSAISTGTMNSKPFCWGDQTGTAGVKFLGVENFFGNIWEFVDGLTMVEHVYKITRDKAKYDDAGTNYETSITGAPTSNAYVQSMKGVEDGTFLPNAVGGAETTYFCDYFYQNSGVRVALFGGYWHSAGRAGAFCWNLSNDASGAVSYVGSRLCRKKVG